jgi:hypothetical protein
MPQLDNYLVTLGMKGQNVVLSMMDKIRKKGGDLTKKKTVTLSAKTAPGVASKKKGGPAASGGDEPTKPRKRPLTPGPGETNPSPTIPPESNKKFGRAAEKFNGGVRSFVGAASSLDPTATIASVTSALGTSLSGISVLGVSLGRLPEGIADIANSTLSMAKNSIDMAKQAAAGYHQLMTRDASASRYGENITKKSPLSRNERAMFIDAISGSMGRIQQPLADEINKLIGKKDTRALASASAGDWESTGTDKGWMLGQISNSFQGLPPSIKQKMQASLLKNNAGEIQDMAPGQADAQQSAAAWANMEEDQTARLAAKASSALPMARRLNDMQVTLYDTGVSFAATIDKTISKLSSLTVEIPKLTTALKKAIDDPSVKNARALMNSMGRLAK